MELCEPTAYGAIPVDLSIDGYDKESIVESNSYGESLIATAYQPWLDLLNAVDSMNMSRKNAARLERLIGVNTGRLDPERAANYLNMMSSQLVHTEREMARDQQIYSHFWRYQREAGHKHRTGDTGHFRPGRCELPYKTSGRSVGH